MATARGRLLLRDSSVSEDRSHSMFNLVIRRQTLRSIRMGCARRHHREDLAPGTVVAQKRLRCPNTARVGATLD
jgi:hypothetical protein